MSKPMAPILRCAYIDAFIREHNAQGCPAERAACVAEIKQMILDLVDATEQSGIDAALMMALDEFTRRAFD